jgi:hypothetical protein
VLFLVFLIVAGPLFGGKSLRQLADEMARAIREWTEWSAPREASGNTIQDLLLLAAVFVVCVAVSRLSALL